MSFRVSVGTCVRRRLEPGLPLRLPVQLLAAMPARLRLFRIAPSMWFHGSAPYTATGTLRSLMGEAAAGGSNFTTGPRGDRYVRTKLAWLLIRTRDNLNRSSG